MRVHRQRALFFTPHPPPVGPLRPRQMQNWILGRDSGSISDWVVLQGLSHFWVSGTGSRSGSRGQNMTGKNKTNRFSVKNAKIVKNGAILSRSGLSPMGPLGLAWAPGFFGQWDRAE